MSLFVEFSLDWRRDPEGYRLVVDPPPPPPSPTRQLHILGGDDQERHTRIFPKGDRLEPCFPLKTRPALYGKFTKIENQAQLLRFVNAHGPLTKDGNDPSKGEDVELGLSAAAHMKRLLASYLDGPEPFGATAPFLARIDAGLAFDVVTAKPKITATVRHLLDGLWFQSAQAIAGGTIVRFCLECSKQFKAGLGRNKSPRRDAKFCSLRHQIAYNNRNRRKEA